MGAESYRPPWATHVVGTYEREIDEDGRPEPTTVRLTCETCGARGQARCESGAPREWVAKFATAHVHHDALAPKEKKP